MRRSQKTPREDGRYHYRLASGERLELLFDGGTVIADSN